MTAVEVLATGIPGAEGLVPKSKSCTASPSGDHRSRLGVGTLNQLTKSRRLWSKRDFINNEGEIMTKDEGEL